MSDLKVGIPVPHATQASIIAESSRYNVLECGRRWGKTQLGLGLAAETAIHGQPFGWFAPTYKYFSEAWDELLEQLGQLIDAKDKAAGRIRLATGGVIDVWSLHDNPHAGRGRKYRRVFIDEAAIVRSLKAVWESAIRPTLTDLRGDAWFASTPYGYNDFHDLFERGQAGDKEWTSWRMGTVTNPYISPEEVEAARHELPESVFEQEYLGIPAPDGGNPFGLESVAACVRPLSAEPAVCYGVDLAKSMDWTVIVGLDESGSVCHFDRWQRVPWEQTTRRLAEQVGAAVALVDSTGVGDPIVERLQRTCPRLEGFQFTQPSKQKLMEGLTLAIHRGEVGYPEGDITRELRTFRYDLSPGGRVRYAAPDGLHDDCVCGLALAVEQRRRLGLRGEPELLASAGVPVERFCNPWAEARSNPDWGWDDD